MLQYWNTEIGLLQNLYRLVRERCIFYDAAVATLYLKINGYVPLNSSAFYANGLNENVDDGAYKQPLQLFPQAGSREFDSSDP